MEYGKTTQSVKPKATVLYQMKNAVTVILNVAVMTIVLATDPMKIVV